MSLTEKLCAAAAISGGGPAAQVAHALALSMMNRGDETETILASVGDLEPNEFVRAQIAVVRACNLFWDLQRPSEARSVLKRARAKMVDADALNQLDAIESAFGCLLVDRDMAVSTAFRVLESARIDDRATVVSMAMLRSPLVAK